MRLSTSALVLVLACGLVVVADADDLDAPATKPVTIRTEIKRGNEAVVDAAVEAEGPLAMEEAVSKILSKNEQDRTDTDAFRLGVNFGAWQECWARLSLGAAYEGTGKNHIDASRMVALEAKAYYGTLRNLSARLKIDDGQLKEMFGVFGYDPARDNPLWEKAVEAGSFKGTMPKH